MSRPATLFLLVAVALNLIANHIHAGLIITDDALYLQRAQMYPYVGWDAFYEHAPASGVLIHPHFVLASAHQAYSGGNIGTPLRSSIEFGFGSNYFTDRGESQVASEVFIHPTFSGVGLGGGGYDLALFYFENPFMSISPITLYTGDIVNGMDSDIVGYGLVQMVNTTETAVTGDRRAGNNVIDTWAFAPPEVIQTRLRSSTDWNFRELGMAARPGHSGGGLMIQGSLAGIVSTGVTSSNIFGTITGYARLDHSWIQSTIASKTVPEPGSLILFCIGSLLAVYRRKHSVS